MKEEKLEQISSLVDDELEQGSRFVLHALATNEVNKGIWARYHMIGECLRGHLPAHIDMQLAGRIINALNNEPVAQGSHRWQRLLKPAAGLAIAASVAAIAILGVRQIGSGPGTTAIPPIAYYNNPPANNSDYQTVTVTAGSTSQQPAPNYGTPVDAARSRLNRYLVNYNEYRANSAVQGTLPYVKIVAHEVDE